jgi:YesN/AraC family two-component response regulator
MYKILITDDEPIVHEGLHSLEWAKWNCEIAGDAYSGQETLDLFPTVNPDIVISDIKMPEMDGIELSRNLKSKYPRVEILLLTGYAEFEYAQEAIRTGIFDFLLKPISIADIKRSIQRCIEKLELLSGETSKNIEKSRMLETINSTIKRQILFDLLEGIIYFDDFKKYLSDFANKKIIVAALKANCNQEIFTIILEKVIRDTLKNLSAEPYLGTAMNTVFQCILFFPANKEDIIITQAAGNWLKEIRCFIWANYHFSVATGLSFVTGELAELSCLGKVSINSLYTQDPFKKVVTGSTNTDKIDANEERSRVDVVKNALSLILLGEREKIAENISSFSADKEGRKTIKQSIKEIIEANLSDTSIKSSLFEALEKACRLEDTARYYEEMVRVLESISGQLCRYSNNFKENIRISIMTYLENNYQSPISLTSLSDKLYYNISYLSRLIRKSTGRSFMDLLTDIRLKKAEELLLNSEQKVADIAQATGFSEAGYFIRVFKGRYGLTPNQFRIKMAPQKNKPLDGRQ